MNDVINFHAPAKKLNKKQRQFQQKTWIIRGNSSKKNRLFKNILNITTTTIMHCMMSIKTETIYQL